MVEMPNGDWAFSMLRQYHFDSFELARLDALSEVTLTGIPEVARKIIPEEQYHLRHTHAWVTRLAQGTDESAHRMQDALNTLWLYVPQMAVPLPGEADVDGLPATPEIYTAWEKDIRSALSEIGLKAPKSSTFKEDRTHHTDHFKPLIDTMQEVARLEPEGNW
jgi:ring-1,2-phenylacetyl-CoA epoxidase subunit PaaC